MTEVSVNKNERPSVEDLVDTLSARAFAYDLLKYLFLQEPSKTFLKRLVEDGLLQAVPFYDSEEDLGGAADLIAAYLNQPDAFSEKEFQKLHWDYTRLFIGPGDVPASPWESLYRDTERLHFSKETLAVRAAYRKYDLLPRRFGHDPDDHIALELDFTQKLCGLAKKKLEDADHKGLLETLTDQKAFLDDHLLKWVPEWSKDVVKHAKTDFYKGAARLLDIYLKLDRQLLQELIAVI